jgi:hypothetical protein
VSEASLGKAVLDLEANVAPFKRNMREARGDADNMQDSLDSLAAVAELATRELQNIRMKADQAAETAGVSERMKRTLAGISTEAERARADIERVKLGTAQAAETEIAGDRIDRKLKDVTRNSNEARRALESVHLASMGAGGGGSGGVPGNRNPGAGVGPFGSGFGRIGVLGTAVGLGVLTTPAAGPAALGLLGAIPALAATGGGALGTLALAFDGVGKAIGGDKKAFDGLGPSAQQFVLTIRSLDGALDRLKETAAHSVFPGLTEGLKSALSPGTVSAITNAVREFGTAIGQAGAQWGKYFGSAEFQSIFGPLMAAGARNLGAMSTAALHLFDAIGVLGRAFAPLTEWLSQSIADGAKFFDVWMHGKDSTGQLTKAMNEAKVSLQLVGNLLLSIGRAVGALGQALYPVSKIAVKDLTDGFNALAGIIHRNQDVIRTIVGTALADLVAVVKVAAEAVKLFVSGLEHFVSHKTAVVGTIAAIGIALALVFGGTGGIVAVAIVAVGEIIRHWGTIKDFFKTLGQWLLNAFQYVWIEMERGALLAALAIVEPFSHLPGFMGGWARKAKDAMQTQLDQLHAPNMDWSQAALDAGVKSGQAWIAGFQSQAAAAAAGVPADTAAKATHGVNMKPGQSRYSDKQVYDLLINAGFSPTDAANFVGIAKAESGLNFKALNDNASTGDYSVGLFQENFFKSLGPARTARYAPMFGLSANMSPDAFVAWLQDHPAAQAAIAHDLFNSSGYSPWQGDAYIKQHPELLSQGGGGGGTVWGTPPPFTSGLDPKPPKPPVIPAHISTLLDLASANASRATQLGNAGGTAKRYLENELADLTAADKALNHLKPKSEKDRVEIERKTTEVENKIRSVKKLITDAIVITGDALLPEKLRARLTALSHQFTADSDYASVLTGDAAAKYQDTIRADLAAQAVVLQKEQASLKTKLSTTHGKQHQAVVDELGKVADSLKSVQEQVLQNLQGVVQTLQGRVGTSLQSVLQELDTAFEAKTQQLIDDLGTKFFQNGLKTPLEQQLADMTAADQLQSELDGIQQAKDQLAADRQGNLLKHVLDVTTGNEWDVYNPAAQKQLDADQKALDAAQRQYDEFELGIRAQEQRTETDRQYTQSLKLLQAERTQLETEMNKRLSALGDALVNGTGSIGDLSKIAADYGLQIDAKTIPDFDTLSDAAGGLMKAFADLAAYIAKITGISPKLAGGSTVTAGGWTGRVDDNGLPISAGFYGFDANGKWVGGDLSSITIPKLAVGGQIRQDGLLYGHRGETIVPAAVDMPYRGRQGVSVNVTGFVGNEMELALQIGRLLQKANIGGVTFGIK